MARRGTIGGKGGPETLLNSQRISQRSPAKRLSAGGRAFESDQLFTFKNSPITQPPPSNWIAARKFPGLRQHRRP
jgi:hypothetical protein